MERKLQSPVLPYVSTAFIHVSDLAKSASFYSMIMGLPFLKDRISGGPGSVYWMELEGGTGLNLDDNSANRKDPNWDESKQNLFMLRTENIDKAYDHLKKMEAEIVTEPENPHPGLTFFRFRDPDGNVLMVSQSDYEGEPIQKDKNRKSPIKNRIKAVFVNAADMRKAVRWYSDLLNIEIMDDSPSVVNVPTEGGCDLLLDNNRYMQGDHYQTLLMFDTDDIDKAYRFIKEKGVEIHTEIERYDNVSFFTFKDLDENVLMVCQEG